MIRALSLAAAFLLLTLAAVRPAAAETVRLDAALKQGLIDLTISGRGAASGDSIQIVIQRKVPRRLELTVDAGMVITSTTGEVQSMLLVALKFQWLSGGWQKAVSIVLEDDRPQTFLFEGYCRDFEKVVPKVDHRFTFGEADPALVKIWVEGRKRGASTKVIQIAIWLSRGEVAEEALVKRYRATSEEIAAARQLLVSFEKPEALVDLEKLLGALREFRAAVKRGDRLKVGPDGAKLTGFGGARVVAELAPGTEVEVVNAGALLGRVRVEGTVDGKTVRGLASANHLLTLEGDSLPSLGEALDEARVEVFGLTE